MFQSLSVQIDGCPNEAVLKCREPIVFEFGIDGWNMSEIGQVAVVQQLLAPEQGHLADAAALVDEGTDALEQLKVFVRVETLTAGRPLRT